MPKQPLRQLGQWSGNPFALSVHHTVGTSLTNNAIKPLFRSLEIEQVFGNDDEATFDFYFKI